LNGRRADCTTCSPGCRLQAAAVSRLLRGEASDGFTCVQDYLGAVYGENDRERRSHVGEKRRTPHTSRVPTGKQTKSTRAEAWLVWRIREKPGHVTRATLLYAAYRAWAEQHDPEGALGYAAFVRVVEQGAPVERVVRLRTERGRPQLAFEGIVLGRSAGFLPAADVE